MGRIEINPKKKAQKQVHHSCTYLPLGPLLFALFSALLICLHFPTAPICSFSSHRKRVCSVCLWQIKLTATQWKRQEEIIGDIAPYSYCAISLVCSAKESPAWIIVFDRNHICPGNNALGVRFWHQGLSLGGSSIIIHTFIGHSVLSAGLCSSLKEIEH